MMTVLEWLHMLGSASWEVLWQPVLIWTAFWIIMEGVLVVYDRIHPAIRYRTYQAAMVSLPIGLLGAALVEVPTIAPAFPALPLAFELGPITVFADGNPVDVALASGASAGITIAGVLGAVTVVAAIAALVQLARLGFDALALQRLRRSISRSAASASNDVGGIRILALHDDAVPMTFGLLRPVIGIPSSLSGEERRLAVQHEILHIRQFDYFAKWMESLVSALFAFHPGVHHLRGRCDLLREMTCDATLLEDESVSRHAYANLLFRFASAQRRPLLSIGVSMADSKPHVHYRLDAMKAYGRNTLLNPQRAGIFAGLLVFLVASTLLTSTQLFAQTDQPVETFALRSADDALFIVDGERYEGVPDGIDPATIARIDVLKGQKAVDLYGEDASNGAIVITTRAAADTTGAPPPPPAVSVVDEMPELIGGLQSIMEQLRYTEAARTSGIEGRVFVQFIVDETGQVEHAEVTRGIGAGLDEEALRAVQAAQFKPGKRDGQPVRVLMTLPVTFKLGESSSGAEARADDVADIPTQFAIRSVFPNPFNPATTLTFDLPERANVRVELFDMTGRSVLTVPERSYNAGSGHTIRIDASELASGAYAYRMTAVTAGETFTANGSFTLVK